MSSFHGLLVIDKPPGMTSRDVVDRAQSWFPRGTRIGHAGTLDPLATGVLVLCVGQATRLIEFVQRMDKTYRAIVFLGATSDTDDAEGTIRPVSGATAPERAALERCLSGFVGEIEQVPPAYSAAKVSGRRAYELARGGKDVSLEPRRVRIHAIELLAYHFPKLELEVRCGKGTYIRSLARDLGEQLGSGGHVQALRRTRIGPFDVSAAIGLDLEAITARAKLLPLAAAVGELPKLSLEETALMRLRQGQALPWPEGSPPISAEVAVFDPTGHLAAVGRLDPERRLLLPDKVLAG